MFAGVRNDCQDMYHMPATVINISIPIFNIRTLSIRWKYNKASKKGGTYRSFT